MGKRSDFEKIPKDRYNTPYSAVRPLLPFLDFSRSYIEPCRGRGDLIRHLAPMRCVKSFDIRGDARKYTVDVEADMFITNPPWTRSVLHPIIENLGGQLPTWLLFDADWMHTAQAAPYLPCCRMIVSVGRVRWMPGTKHDGKDNCCWYRFEPRWTDGPHFVGR